MTDVRRMQIGQIVDFCVTYNEREKKAAERAEEKSKRSDRRKATQADIDAFFG